jgi:hypothetical protein
MFFSGKRVNKIDRYVKRADLRKRQYVYHDTENEESAFSAVGLPANAAVGDTILPRILGPVSEFNADGKWLVHKDQPLEMRTIGQRIWRWREFRGRYDYEDKARIVDIRRECYPRTFVDPPSLEMTVQVVGDRRRLVTELPENSDTEMLRHAVNLYLEFFGRCHLTDHPDEVPIVFPKRVNWRMLPPGGTPWERAESAVSEKTAPLSADTTFIIAERQKYICSLGPTEVYVGEGGFSDYLAYVFADRDLAVLESVSTGNAIYVFEGDWRRLSQLTKREILSGNLQKARIIHATGWPQRLRDAFA